MIRLLKRLADWLDQRFPAKVTINEETFNDLQRRLMLLERHAELHIKRLDAHEDAITASVKSLIGLKESLTRGGALAVKSEAEKLRDEFVQGTFRGAQRAEVEKVAS